MTGNRRTNTRGAGPATAHGSHPTGRSGTAPAARHAPACVLPWTARAPAPCATNHGAGRVRGRASAGPWLRPSGHACRPPAPRGPRRWRPRHGRYRQRPARPAPCGPESAAPPPGRARPGAGPPAAPPPWAPAGSPAAPRPSRVCSKCFMPRILEVMLQRVNTQPGFSQSVLQRRLVLAAGSNPIDSILFRSKLF